MIFASSTTSSQGSPLQVWVDLTRFGKSMATLKPALWISRLYGRANTSSTELAVEQDSVFDIRLVEKPVEMKKDPVVLALRNQGCSFRAILTLIFCITMRGLATIFSGMFLPGKTCLPGVTIQDDLITASKGCQVGLVSRGLNPSNL